MRSPRPAPRSDSISASTTPVDRIRALTGRRRIKPISQGCRRSRRPEPRRRSTYLAVTPVQTNRAISLRGAADAAVRGFGHLDVLVANAGIQVPVKLSAMQDREWQDVIDVSLTGVA